MSQGLWCPFILLLIQTSQQQPSLTATEYSSSYHPTRVVLRCDSSTEQKPNFLIRVDNITRNVSVEGMNMNSNNLICIDLSPQKEGYYSCEIDGVQSNEVVLIAYPIINPNVSRSYTARLGESLVVKCNIQVGALRNKYRVQWFKGISVINASYSRDLSIGDDYSLQFSNIRTSDYSRGYYCMMTVSMIDGPVTRRGPTIELNILASFQVTKTPRNVAVETGRNATFTCHASGVPLPRIKWLLNGTEQHSGIISKRSGIAVESTLVLIQLTERHTGPVTCLAYQVQSVEMDPVQGAEMNAVSSTANLIILTNDFSVDLTVQDGEVRMRGVLPAHIIGIFLLKVRFYASNSQTEDRVIFDHSLQDTNMIDIQIEKEELPSFRSFSAAAAIVTTDGATGPFSRSSAKIVLPSGVSNPCSRPSNTVAVAVLSVFVVVFLLIIIILITYGCMIYYKRRAEYKKSSSIYSGSLHRSLSGSSYNSQGSHGQHRNRSRSTLGDCQSYRGEGVESEVLQETPSQNNDTHYDSIDHKKLEQWSDDKFSKADLGQCSEDYSMMPIKRSSSKDTSLKGGSSKDMVQGDSSKDISTLQGSNNSISTKMSSNKDLAVKQDSSDDTSLKEITGHFNVANPGHRQSSSSFEDLEDEYLEFNKKPPRY